MMAKLLLLLQSHFFSLNHNLHIEALETDIYLQADSLLCLLDANTFGYILYSNSKKKIYCLKVWDFEKDEDISTILEKELGPENQIISFKILNYSARYQTIPNIFDITNNKKVIWDITNGYDHNEEVLTDISTQNDIIFLHSVSKNSFNYINQRFPNINWHSIQSIHFINNVHNSERLSIRLIFFFKHIHISVAQNEKILIAKSYLLSSPNDLLWELLRIVKLFGYTPEQVILYPEGFIDIKSSLFQLLDQYFERGKSTDTFQYQFPISDIELSHLTLVHIERILSCVS